MNPVVAVIAPGMMGAAVGARLADHGLKVLTSLEGRSAETRERAKAATGYHRAAVQALEKDLLPAIRELADAIEEAPISSCSTRKSTRSSPELRGRKRSS